MGAVPRTPRSGVRPATNHYKLSRLMRLCKDVTLTPYGFCDFGEKKTKKKNEKKTENWKKSLPELSGAIRSYLFSVFFPPGAIRSYPELSGAIFFLVFSFPELSGAIRSYEFLIFFTPGAIRSYLLCFFLVFFSSGAIRSYPELPGAIKNWFLGKKTRKSSFEFFF